MRNNRGIFVGMSNEAIKKVFDSVCIKAFAEEGDTSSIANTSTGDLATSSTSSTSGVLNYEDLIAKARKEEKDKQYKTIEKLKTQIDTLTGQHNDDLLKVAGLEKELNEAKESLKNSGSKDDSEEVKTLKATIETLKNEKTTLEGKVQTFENTKVPNREEIEAEVRASLEAEYEVKTYKATKLLEMKDDILVPELVFGNTKEEIDNSIQKALERSNEIKKNLGISEKTASKRTPKSTNPSVSSVQDKAVSLEKLASMDVSSPEYAELRKQLGLR